MSSMAASATLHCLTGCAIGEIVGLIAATALGWGNGLSTAVAIALAFVFGYTLSATPLLRSGIPAKQALLLVLHAGRGLEWAGLEDVRVAWHDAAPDARTAVAALRDELDAGTAFVRALIAELAR